MAADGSGRARLMSERQVGKKRPQIIRAPEIGVILPQNLKDGQLCTGMESTKKQKQLSFFGQFPIGTIFSAKQLDTCGQIIKRYDQILHLSLLFS